MEFFRFPNHILKLKALEQPLGAGEKCPLAHDMT